MNNAERENWIENDETLYRWRNQWCRRNRGGTRGFIRAHRAEIDEHIDRIVNRRPRNSWAGLTH